ncbi:MAG: PAS domain-containing protein [bacterium]
MQKTGIDPDQGDLWIHMDDKFIYIRYFPLYDKQGNYKGVIEVSQEVSDIQKLKGEWRLLDW